MRYLLFIIAVLWVNVTFAVPAKRVKVWKTLPDGSLRELTLQGDEFFHYYTDEDGQAYQEVNDHLEPCTLDVLKVKQKARARQANKTRSARRKAIFKGKKKGLVILVNFQDKTFSQTDPKETFNGIFNTPGYSQGDFHGSVHDYFYDCSYGQFDLEFDVVGPYTISQNMSYYGSNDSQGNDRHPAKMIIEACHAADAEVNFADYDWSGDGYVDQVYVIYAGYSEAQNGGKDAIWPHEWDLESAAYSRDGDGPIETDGVTINTYACSNELAGNRGKYIDGIGTACHEFCHCLGLPDMYDIEGSNFGMDSWDLLDYGTYNGDGYIPAPLTSYERMFCGWLTPRELNSPYSIRNMPAIVDAPVAYIIYNDAEQREFYMLENHQQHGWDSGSYGHGLLVLHVDYNEDVWNDNRVNTVASHQRMTIIPADNNKYSNEYGLSGDPYPGRSGNTSLTDFSSPAATLYNNNLQGTRKMGKPITDIHESAEGLINFDFMGGGPIVSAVKSLSASATVAPISIYTPDGQLVFQGSEMQTQTMHLTKGLYIIQKGDRTYKKIIQK